MLKEKLEEIHHIGGLNAEKNQWKLAMILRKIFHIDFILSTELLFISNKTLLFLTLLQQ